MSIDPSDWIKPEPPAFSQVTAQLEIDSAVYSSMRNDWNGQAAAPVKSVFDQFGIQALYARRETDANESTRFLAVRVPQGNMDDFVKAISQVPGIVSASPDLLARLA